MDQSFYIPRTNYAPGNPWGSAAAAYGNDLDRLQAQQQQGYQIQAQGPLSIYDRFMQGYQQAKAQQQADAQAQQDADFKQQQIAIQKQRWDQQDQQAKLRDTAVLQGAVARSYRPELRQAFKAQLQAINPEWDDNKLEAALPAKTPETIKIGDNAPVPLSPYDPVTLRNPNMQDTFRGMDVLREEDAVRKSEAANALMEKIAAQKDSTTKALADQKSELMMKLQELRGQQGLQSLQVKIDAGALGPKQPMGPQSGKGIDFTKPLDDPAEEVKAGLIADGKMNPQQINRGNPRADIVNARANAISLANGGRGVDLPGFRADSGSLASIQKQSDAVEAFSRTALGNFQRFRDALKGAKDTGSPWLNRPLRALESAAGDPSVAAILTSGRVAVNEAAKVLSNPNMSGVLSDSARHEIEGIIPGGIQNATAAQAEAVMNVLEADMAQRRREFQNQITEIRQRGSGRSAQPSPNAPQGDRVTVRSKTGQVGTIPRTQLGQAKLEGYTEVQ